jgi:hypothetical protein
MKKNKLFLFIIFFIAALIIGSAAISCSDEEAEYKKTTIDTKPEDALHINGVVPIKLTGQNKVDKTKDLVTLEFWNIGKHGAYIGYDLATYEVKRNGRTIKVLNGYFTGGPNGEFYFISSDKKLHGKLVDGKEYIGDDGEVLAIDNPEAFDGWTEDKAEEVAADSTEVEETSTETDANLHGLVPTKVTIHTHQATDNKDSYSDHYIELWNIGELGGEQYAKATDHYVATRDGAQFSEITFEGTFTGGPNGDIEMSAVSSSGNDKGSTAKIELQLIDGKQLENPSNGYILQIVNPEALVEAFDGWKE